MNIQKLKPGLLAGLIILLSCGFAFSNIWIDETFDDGAAFDPSALDTFDSTLPTTPPVTFTVQDGAISTVRAYNGSYSYELTAGDTLSVGAANYEAPTNGAFQYIQFTVSLGSILASAGSMAELRWNWNLGDTDYSFYLDFQSTGTEVNIIAGEDLAGSTSGTIDTIYNTATWKNITIQVQKNAADATDSRTGQTLSQGARFYSSSDTPGFEVILPGTSGATDISKDWSINVTDSSIFIDDFYWEGGMTNGNEGDSNLRGFTGPFICDLPVDYPVVLTSVGPDALYDSIYAPHPTGWLGADAAYSIPITADTSVWLFGDTLIGNINGTQRQLTAFINNSIAIHDLSGGAPGTVTHYWGDSGGSPASFFPPVGTGFYYWPTMGFNLSGELFIFAYKITPGGPFGFSVADTTLIRIPNPTDPPASWVQNVNDLGLGDNNQSFMSAAYVDDPYVYFMGMDDLADDALQRRAVLARALITDLQAGGLGEVFEFWVDGGSGPEWGTAHDDTLVSLFSPGNTESAIQYDPVLELFFTTTYYAFTPEIYITTAPDLTGPWSDPACIYQIPEHVAEPSYISYAAKAHPELSTTDGEIIITYAVNGDFANDLNIYYPRFVRLNFELNPLTGIIEWISY